MVCKLNCNRAFHELAQMSARTWSAGSDHDCRCIDGSCQVRQCAIGPAGEKAERPVAGDVGKELAEAFVALRLTLVPRLVAAVRIERRMRHRTIRMLRDDMT